MELEGRHCVVTGGAGFVGSHVVDRLVAMGNEVTVIDDLSTGDLANIAPHLARGCVRFIEGDVCDPDAMERAMRGAEVVIHMAVACVRASINYPRLGHDVNATGTLVACQAALQNGVERFVYVSSSEVYGGAHYVPVDEDHPLNPTNVYGASKAAGEMYALATWRTHGLPAMVVRFFNVYGPREHCEGIPAEVIPRFVLRVLAGQPPIIFGNGEQTRDYTWVDDSVAGLIAATKCDALVGDIVHLGRGQETSVNTLAQLVLQKLGREDLEPIYLGSDRPGDVPRLRANTAKARNLFGFDPQVSVEEGLDRFIAWVQEYGPEPVAWAERQAVENW